MSDVSKSEFTIVEMVPEDVEEATRMRLQSWLDTYVNEAAGVTRDWIEARNTEQMTPEKNEARKQRLQDPNVAAWVAKDTKGSIIGMTTPYRVADGVQHVGSLYVDKNWHGKGVGQSLMQKVIDWADPSQAIELEVTTYNDRARAFYRKWGFEEIPGSESLFENTIPGIKMVRKGVKA